MPRRRPPVPRPAALPEPAVEPSYTDDRDEFQAEPRLSRPHTTRKKAELCEALFPFVADFRQNIWALALKNLDAKADGLTLALGRRLLIGCNSVLAGESEAERLAMLAFRSPMTIASAGLAAGQMLEGLKAFRARYFGPHPLHGRPAWFLANRWGMVEATYLGPAPEAPAAPRSDYTPEQMQAMREKLAKVIDIKVG